MLTITSPSYYHKSRFVALSASRDGHRRIDALANEAQRRLLVLADHARRATEIQAAVDNAEKDADATVEIFLSGVPAQITAVELVQAIQLTIHRSGFIERRYPGLGNRAAIRLLSAAVLKCEIAQQGCSYNPTFCSAHVVLRDRDFACTLINESPIDIHRYPVSVVESRVSFPVALRSRRRAPLDPGRISWRLGQAQAGEKLTNDLFSCLWTSAPQYDLSDGTCVELRPLDRCFTIITGRQQVMYKKGAKLLEFERISSKLRLDIPFHFLSADPCVEEDGEFFAVHLPLSKPPFIYRGEVTANRKNKTHMWNFNGGVGDDLQWIRTIDPTPNDAFSRTTGIRLLFHPEEIYRFFEEIHRLRLASAARPNPVTIKAVEEITAPNPTSMFRKAAEHYGASFAICYSVDRVLSQHRLPLSYVTPDFWLKLCTELEEEDALLALECMSFLLYNANLRVIGSTVAMLDECIDLCNMDKKGSNFRKPCRSNPVVRHGHVIQNDGDESIWTESSDEELKIARYVRELNLERISDESIEGEERCESPPSLVDESESEIPKIRRRSTERTFVRRLLYTPTRTIALKPESYLMNRILREFALHSDRFIRLTFCDEDLNSIAFTDSDDLLARVRQALRGGVHCAGEKFVFLAFSSSQLRENAVWMYNETPNLNDRAMPPVADEIRAWMGDFSKIRIPAKFAARQGQVLSSTIGAVVLDAVQETEISDVYDEKGNYAFSDGVGLISSNLARKVCEELELKPSHGFPSAFQIRYGGAKGILTVWDAVLPAGELAEIALRPSMKKFGCKHRVLEIVGVARRLPLFLNRQIIMILSGLGVPDEPFEDMQRTLLESLDRGMQSTGAKDALNLLLSSGFCEYDIKISNATPPSMNPGSYFRAGLTCSNCEHLFNMMCAFRRRTIKDVMGRARIPVDWSKGISAVGVMDELGVLKPGEVFCQFTKPSSKKVVNIKGMVTVGRYPCHHPGDIQPLLAVDVPELHHLIDVIVFPRTGWRPITSMLSGGDLDGDIYFCIFDELIAFPPNGPYPPMSYERPKPVELARDVNTADVADFFVDYIKNDKLGKIASAHMLHGDRETDGIYSARCLELAEMHSVAVDFAKTGIPPRFSGEQKRWGRPLRYPDFMGKPDRISYPSRRVLGKLHRACKGSHGLSSERERFKPNPSSIYIDNIIENIGMGCGKYLKEAEVLCNAYNVELIRLMEMYGVQSEGEMMSGQVVAFSANQAQLRARREYASLLARLNRETNELQNQFRGIFFRGLNGWEGKEYSEDMILKACAWHMACREKADAERAVGNIPLVSFPWVVADVLLGVLGKVLF